MVKDHSDSEKGNPLLPHRLLLSINSNGQLQAHYIGITKTFKNISLTISQFIFDCGFRVSNSGQLLAGLFQGVGRLLPGFIGILSHVSCIKSKHTVNYSFLQTKELV